MKVCAKDGMPKTTLIEITVSKFVGQDYGIEKHHWGPSFYTGPPTISLFKSLPFYSCFSKHSP